MIDSTPEAHKTNEGGRSDLGTVRLDAGFALALLGTIASRGILVGLGLATSILVARVLGPEGRGEFAVAITVAAVGVQLANVGLHTASAWTVSKDQALLGRLIGNGLLVSAAVGGAFALVVAVFLALLPALVPLEGPMLALALISIPVGLGVLILLNLSLGLQRIRLFNLLELGQRVASTIAMVVLAATGLMTAASAFGAVVAASIASLAIALIALRPRASGPLVDLRLLRANATYGFRAYLAAMFTFVVLRLDVLLLDLIRGAGEVGVYVVAVSVAEFVFLPASTTATLLFPRLTAMADGRARWLLAWRVTLLTAAGVSVVAMVAALAANFVVPALYGAPFIGAVEPLVILLPGMIFLSVHTIVMHYFYAIGAPAITILAPAVGSTLNVALNLALIPAAGAAGAAFASSVAYAVMLLLSTGYFLLLAHRKENRAVVAVGR